VKGIKICVPYRVQPFNKCVGLHELQPTHIGTIAT